MNESITSSLVYILAPIHSLAHSYSLQNWSCSHLLPPAPLHHHATTIYHHTSNTFMTGGGCYPDGLQVSIFNPYRSRWFDIYHREGEGVWGIPQTPVVVWVGAGGRGAGLDSVHVPVSPVDMASSRDLIQI